MRSLAFSLLLTLHASSLALAAESIDELYARRTELKKKIEELKKELDTADAAIKGQFLDLQGKLAKDGIIEPGPVPPAPPPKPVDALKQKLRAAFDSDKGSKDDALQLAELYKLASKLAKDAEVPSTADLLRRVREASATLVGNEVLKGVRKEVAAALAAALGKSSDEPITQAERDAAADLFLKLATILGEL
jgi:hypothetical protein